MIFCVPSEEISTIIKKYQELMKHGYKVMPNTKVCELCFFNVKYHFAISFRKRAWVTYGKVISPLRSDIRFDSFLYTFVNYNTSVM